MATAQLVSIDEYLAPCRKKITASCRHGWSATCTRLPTIWGAAMVARVNDCIWRAGQVMINAAI